MTADIDLAAISQVLKEQLDENSAIDAATSQQWRWHLGVSIIGKECHRAIWYDFRWFTVPRLIGRLARLFQRGHDEEVKIVGMLRRDGWTVHDRDPATGKQWLYTAVHGHYGGSCDGKIKSGVTNGKPPGPFGAEILLEMKTHNTKSFSNFVEKGLIDSKPQHHTQMNAYGHGFGLDYGLYFPVNKNDDDIAPTFVKLNRDEGQRMELRAESIITATTPPAKISTKATNYRCKSCDHLAVCQQGSKPAEQCRSCRNSHPTEGSEWFCTVHNAVIPRDVVRTGCGTHYKVIAI